MYRQEHLRKRSRERGLGADFATAAGMKRNGLCFAWGAEDSEQVNLQRHTNYKQTAFDQQPHYSHYNHTKAIHPAKAWDKMYTISDYAREELGFWLSNIRTRNGRALKSAPSYDATNYSDASDVGFGGYETSRPDLPVQGLWSDHEQKKSSTWRELKAIWYSLHGLQHAVSNKSVVWYVDQQGCSQHPSHRQQETHPAQTGARHSRHMSRG